MRRAIILLAAGILVACSDQDSTGPAETTRPANAVVAAVNSWLQRADYPVNVYGAASASITNTATNSSTLYVIGGKPRISLGEGSITDAVKAFNVRTNTWTSKAPLPVRMYLTNGAVVINNRIYISGGYTRQFDEVDQVYRLGDLKRLYVYNPATNSWTRKKDMPIYTANGVSGSYGGFLYVAASCFGASYCELGGGALFRYNPANDNWVLLTLTPHDPWDAGGGFVGSKFYLLTVSGEMDVYDVTTRTWSTAPKRPFTGGCEPAYATLQSKLYLAGCHDNDDFSGSYPLLMFSPATNLWTELAVLPTEVTGYHFMSRVVVNGQLRLDLIGGDKPGNHWEYIP